MEELQDAIEDAQYVNAIATQDDIRPIVPWPIPSDEELQEWKEHVTSLRFKDMHLRPQVFSLEWVLQNEIGLYMFSSYVKETSKTDYPRMNFVEDVCRYHHSRGKAGLAKARSMMKAYFLKTPQRNQTTNEVVYNRKTDIEEFDLIRNFSPTPALSKEEIDTALTQNYDFPQCSESVTGLKGKYRTDLVQRVQELEDAFRVTLNNTQQQQSQETPSAVAYHQGDDQDDDKEYDGNTSGDNDDITPEGPPKDFEVDGDDSVRSSSDLVNVPYYDKALFDKAEAIIVESIKRDHWEGFKQSTQHARLLHFLWYQDRDVVPEDFYVMRVLGRGGFGLVTGMCLYCSLLLEAPLSSFLTV